MFDKRYRVERGRHGAPKVRRPVGGQQFKRNFKKQLSNSLGTRECLAVVFVI